MPGTPEGGFKTKAKVLERNPNWYKEIGAKGGQNSNNGGFASLKKGKDGLTGVERASKYGRIGGMAGTGKRKTRNAAADTTA